MMLWQLGSSLVIQLFSVCSAWGDSRMWKPTMQNLSSICLCSWHRAHSFPDQGAQMVPAKMTSALFHCAVSFFVIFLQASCSVKQCKAAGWGQADTDKTKLIYRKQIIVGSLQCRERMTFPCTVPFIQGCSNFSVALTFNSFIFLIVCPKKTKMNVFPKHFCFFSQLLLLLLLLHFSLYSQLRA